MTNVRANPQRDLAWQTFLTNQDGYTAEQFDFAFKAFVAAWGAATALEPRVVAESLAGQVWAALDDLYALVRKQDMDPQFRSRIELALSVARWVPRGPEPVSREPKCVDPNGPPHELRPLLENALKALEAGVAISPGSYVHDELKRLLAEPASREASSTEHPAVGLLRQWLLADSSWDDETWIRQVRDLVEDGTMPTLKSGVSGE